MNPALLMKADMVGGVIGDDFGGIRVGKRKKKAAVVNGNGDR